MSEAPLTVEAVMTLAPVIPVLVVEDVAHARPIAEALVRGGIRALEVTLRTPAALDVIRAMSEVDGAVVGAGTVINPHQLDQAIDAGARFIVSPGLVAPLTEAVRERDIAYLPGVATAADIMRGLDHGLTNFKFFPAETSGGIKALQALAAPFFQCRFCPTGGVTLASAPEWLALPAVRCVGGSWLVPKGEPNPALIETNARAAASLAG